MVKTYKNIKEIVYRTVLGGLFLLNVATTSLAQEGTIDDKVNGEISNQPGISDKTEKTEQPEYLKELDDKINNMFQEDLANSVEIGGKPAYKVIEDGREYYSVEGLDYLLLRVETKNKNLSSYTEVTKYLIEQGFKEVRSAIYYTPDDVNFFRKSKEKDCAYVLTNKENTKQVTQDKEE